MSCRCLLGLLLLATVILTVSAVPSPGSRLRAARLHSHRRSLNMKKGKDRPKKEKTSEDDKDKTTESTDMFETEEKGGDVDNNSNHQLEDPGPAMRLTLAGTKYGELGGSGAPTSELVDCLGIVGLGDHFKSVLNDPSFIVSCLGPKGA